MLVDEDGGFISQRQFPKLAQLCTSQINEGIALSWPGQNWLKIPTPSPSRQQVTVWKSTVDAASVQGEINAALSGWLGHSVTLVFMDENAERLASAKWTTSPSPVSFADGYPVLITNTASLTALNNYIMNTGGVAIYMDRFRPNIVIECDTPWAENSWKSLQIGEVILDLVKPCARCIMTSIDQKTGVKTPKTALSALKHLNPSNDPNNPGVLFGWNAVVKKQGIIHIRNFVRSYERTISDRITRT